MDSDRGLVQRGAALRAGGQVRVHGRRVVAAAIQLRDQNGPALKGIILAYPVCDSDFESSSYREFATGYVLTRDRMAAFWNAYVEQPHDRERGDALP